MKIMSKKMKIQQNLNYDLFILLSSKHPQNLSYLQIINPKVQRIFSLFKFGVVKFYFGCLIAKKINGMKILIVYLSFSKFMEKSYKCCINFWRCCGFFRLIYVLILESCRKEDWRFVLFIYINGWSMELFQLVLIFS